MLKNQLDPTPTVSEIQKPEPEPSENVKPKEIKAFLFPAFDFSCEAENPEEAQKLLQIHLENQK